MNKEDIQVWATQARLPQNYMTGEAMWLDRLERFAALVAAAEREACAKVCDELETCSDAEFYGHEFAAAIRARRSK